VFAQSLTWELLQHLQVAWLTCPLSTEAAPSCQVHTKLIYSPGQGPTKEAYGKDTVEYRVSVTADQLSNGIKKRKRALGSIIYQGGMYQLTAASASEAARQILDSEDEIRQKYGGGFLTPATLGQKYVNALERVGFSFDAKLVDD